MPPGIGGMPAPFSSGSSVIITSVVSMRLATEAAFWSAERVTLVGLRAAHIKRRLQWLADHFFSTVVSNSAFLGLTNEIVGNMSGSQGPRPITDSNISRAAL